MIENILEVRISDEIFGIDADKIIHILRIPPITPLTMVDSSIKGISVILGKIVSVVDIGILLGFSKNNSETDESRILTISNDTSILVDEVLDMITLNKEHFEEVESKYISGFYKNNKNIIQILNVKSLLEDITHSNFFPKKIETISDEHKIKQIDDNETIRCLFFKLGKEKFSMDISMIQEIIFIPEITPNRKSNQLGLLTLREEIIPIIDMKELFGFEKQNINEKSRAIIVKHNGLLALLVDEIEEVKDIDLTMIEKIKNEKFEGIFKGNSLSSLLSNLYIKKLIEIHNISDEKKEIIIRDSDMIEVVVFKIDDEEFAFNINNVQEIIKYEKATFFPQAPNFVEGLLNLRGSVIPIVSLPNKLGFKETITDKTKIIVCNVKDEKIGFVVDDVSDIMFIEDIYISKVENEDSIFDEVINIDDRVIFNIEIDKIFTEDEFDGIKLSKVKDNG